MNAISIGPLVFDPTRFAAIVAIAIFLGLVGILARRVDHRLNGWSWAALVAFIVGGRIGHVLQHLGNFWPEPLRMLAIWQGGFMVTAGLLAAGLVTILYFWRQPQLFLMAAIPTASAAFVAFVLTTLTAGVQPTPLPAGNYIALDGRTVAPASLTGKPIVVNLWATWCPPCRREMPMMADVARSRSDASFIFVNQGEAADAVRRYLTKEGIVLENHILLDSLGQFSRHYTTPGLPATLFIGGDGTLRSVHMGEISREALIAGIEKAR